MQALSELEQRRLNHALLSQKEETAKPSQVQVMLTDANGAQVAGVLEVTEGIDLSAILAAIVASSQKEAPVYEKQEEVRIPPRFDVGTEVMLNMPSSPDAESLHGQHATVTEIAYDPPAPNVLYPRYIVQLADGRTVPADEWSMTILTAPEPAAPAPEQAALEAALESESAVAPEEAVPKEDEAIERCVSSLMDPEIHDGGEAYTDEGFARDACLNQREEDPQTFESLYGKIEEQAVPTQDAAKPAFEVGEEVFTPSGAIGIVQSIDPDGTVHLLVGETEETYSQDDLLNV